MFRVRYELVKTLTRHDEIPPPRQLRLVDMYCIYGCLALLLCRTLSWHLTSFNSYTWKAAPLVRRPTVLNDEYRPSAPMMSKRFAFITSSVNPDR